jgi:hypothetical protein
MEKHAPQAQLGHIYPSWQDKHLGDESFLMYFQLLNFVHYSLQFLESY